VASDATLTSHRLRMGTRRHTYTEPMRRLIIAALSAVALTAAMAPVLIAPPAVNTACAPGETAAATTCAPFCLPGRYFDYDHTGLCLPDPPPPADPNGVVLQSVLR
jgi:hypothetical protein